MSVESLDKKDLAILRILDQDVRASLTEIGRKTRLSKEVVQYRLRKLEQEKIITGYWTFIKYLEGSVYKILIKNRSLSGKEKEDFIQFVKDYPIVSWFANTEGNYDYIITVFTSDDMEIIEFSKSLLEKFGSFFKERHILKCFETNITNEKYLSNGKFIYEYKNQFSKQRYPEDAEDNILRLLSLNSRMKFTEIAQKIGITAEAVKYRYKEIMKKQLIAGFKMRLNWEKLGLAYYHMFITLQDQSKREEIKNYYKIHPDFNASMQHIGHYDMHIELILEPGKIEAFMEDFISRFGDVIEGYELLRIRKEYLLNILK